MIDWDDVRYFLPSRAEAQCGLATQNLMDHEYIAIGPLMPLRLLTANP